MSALERKLDAVLKDSNEERTQKNILLQEMTVSDTHFCREPLDNGVLGMT